MLANVTIPVSCGLGDNSEKYTPSFAIKNAGELPRFRNYKINEHGCNLWWVEYGGRLDTIHQSEEIKFELWRVVYGIWDYVKNSGKYPESKNLTLEWVGTIPGKRESRRFVGDHILVHKDIVEQKEPAGEEPAVRPVVEEKAEVKTESVTEEKKDDTELEQYSDSVD